MDGGREESWLWGFFLHVVMMVVVVVVLLFYEDDVYG
jgi:hypothetical protein